MLRFRDVQFLLQHLDLCILLFHQIPIAVGCLGSIPRDDIYFKLYHSCLICLVAIFSCFSRLWILSAISIFLSLFVGLFIQHPLPQSSQGAFLKLNLYIIYFRL
jgi:hypothetical protein